MKKKTIRPNKCVVKFFLFFNYFVVCWLYIPAERERDKQKRKKKMGEEKSLYRIKRNGFLLS